MTVALTGALCVAVFLWGHLTFSHVDNQLIGSDGTKYYAYLPSLWIDHDLDFSNQYAYLYGEMSAWPEPLTPRGVPGNDHWIGPALLWSPFFLAYHAFVLVMSPFFSLPSDGMSWGYQGAVLVGTIVIGTMGAALVLATARRFFSKPAALLGTLAIWLGTNLAYYMVVEGSMSHVPSFFTAALFVWYWVKTLGDGSPGRFAKLGLLVGLGGLVRPQDAVTLGAMVAVEVMASVFSRSLRRDWAGGARLLAASVVTPVVALVVFAPQLMIWQWLYGNVLEGKVPVPGVFRWANPHLFDAFFSTDRGLFSWHPVLLLGLAGLVLLARRAPLVSGGMLLAFAIQAYLISTWWDWGDAFGGRAFIGAFPILAVGLSAIAEQLISRKLGRLVLVATAVAALYWNGAFIVQYRFGFVPMSGPITLDQLLWDKLTLPLNFLGRLIWR